MRALTFLTGVFSVPARLSGDDAVRDAARRKNRCPGQSGHGKCQGARIKQKLKNSVLQNGKMER